MNKTKKFLLFGITIVVLVFTVFWNFYVNQWLEAQPDGGEATIRVDLFVLWPLCITLVALSLFQIFGKKRN